MFQLPVKLGIRKHADSWGLSIICFPPYEKSIIERKMQYIKDRTECFIDFLLLAKEEMQIKAHNQLVKPFGKFSQQGIKD